MDDYTCYQQLRQNQRMWTEFSEEGRHGAKSTEAEVGDDQSSELDLRSLASDEYMPVSEWLSNNPPADSPASPDQEEALRGKALYHYCLNRLWLGAWSSPREGRNFPSLICHQLGPNMVHQDRGTATSGMLGEASMESALVLPPTSLDSLAESAWVTAVKDFFTQ